MINLIKFQIKRLITMLASLVFKTRVGKFASEKLIYLSLNSEKEIYYRKYNLRFAVPNSISRFRIDTFATKEPETLSWIDTFERNAVFWDIGANIGLYSCYAAKSTDCKVYAFEPSIFNLELLGRNISLNRLTDKVIIIPIPLTENLLENKLSMSTTEWSGSGSTFGQNYTHDGSKLIEKFNYRTVGISMDQAISLLKLPQPNYIKMDVDGIEHLILKGGSEVLKKTKSLLVEVDDKFEIQKQNTTEYLRNAGFKLAEKRHSRLFEGTKYDSCFNQIWKKN